MCIAFFCLTSYTDEDGTPRIKFIAIDNRDEYYERKTSRMHWWSEPHGDILAPRDLQRGGTWLGVRRLKDHVRAAFLTNIRVPEHQFGKESRGNLISDFLQSDLSVQDFFAQLEPSENHYAGFNMVMFDGESLGYCCNMNPCGPIPAFTLLELGVLYGISNSVLSNPWIKVNRGKQALETILAAHNSKNDMELCRKMMPVMADAQRVENRRLLPHTGCTEDLEYQLSSIFVEPLNNSMYGTRTTIAMVIDGAHAHILENDLDVESMTWSEKTFAF
ncbi:unnamed protein product [Aphanomyces euteiches]|uniref:Uncharacterized protein n=1 Tax=Aphanomyces euteiches TaxID=100861 RepID=A0A6G0XKT6_9STRA|nr:hypothetical protein Ae201684_003752 [Aphanomyces euteiches]KAH9084861.1 hypothetical protein Ae201684P_002098 [Aphanomyces euteiches]KAH9140771.1 hypothetical protein AeRB84_015007 [Aphanomyces euteiches]